MSLTPEQRRSLDDAWILRDRHPAIQVAVEAGFAVFWSRNVKNVFVKNYADAIANRPSNWSQLGEAIGMNSKHLSRYSAELERNEGELRNKLTLPDTLLRHRAAVALGVPEEQMSPSSAEWIAESAMWLIRITRTKCTADCDQSMFRTFASYVLAASHNGHCDGLSEQGLNGARMNHEDLNQDQLKSAILTAAQVIGEALCSITRETQD